MLDSYAQDGGAQHATLSHPSVAEDDHHKDTQLVVVPEFPLTSGVKIIIE
jgi:hypothetical protein